MQSAIDDASDDRPGHRGQLFPPLSASAAGDLIDGTVVQLAVNAGLTVRLGDAAGFTKGDAIRRRLRSTYFDTEDRRLTAHGLSLSVRSDGRHHVQTVAMETAPDDGVDARDAWQGEVAEPAPQIEAIADPQMRERVGFLTPGALKTMFTTEIEREERIVEVCEGGQTSLIAVAFDHGEISAGAAVAPLREIELRLLQGSAAALYRTGLVLLDRTPMTIEPHSKAERGFALVNGTPPPSKKAFAIALDAEMTVEDGMGCILAACFRHFLSNQAAAADGRDPEGVHQFRVALRRLRSALTTFKPVLPPAQLARMQEEARWSVRSLNPARDWDVFLDELLPPVAGTGTTDCFASLETAARAAREAGYEEARAMLRSPRYTRLVLELALWLAERGWRRESSAEAGERLAEPIAGYAGILLGKRHRTALKRGKGFDKQTPDERHRLRIALKKLRYVAEFFRSLYPAQQTKAYLGRLKSLQDTLGHLNDVATAERLIGGLIEAAEAKGRVDKDMTDLAMSSGRVLGWYAHGIDRLEPDARRDWKEFKTAETFW